MQINDHVLFDVRGVLWLTETPLAKRPEGLEELDHLFDGLISQHIANHSEPTSGLEKNIFGGKSFDRFFVLIQLWSENQKEIQQQIKSCLELIPKSDERAQVLVIGTKGDEKLNAFAKDFPHIQFKVI